MPKNRKPSQNDKTPCKNSDKKYNAMQKKLTQNVKIYAKKLTPNGKIYAKKLRGEKTARSFCAFYFVRFIILCYFTILPRFRRCFSGVLLRRFAP